MFQTESASTALNPALTKGRILRKVQPERKCRFADEISRIAQVSSGWGVLSDTVSRRFTGLGSLLGA